MTPEQEQFNIALGLRIRNARKEKGLMQEDVANLIGLTRVTLVNIEAGRHSTTIFAITKLKTVLDFEIPGLETKQIKASISKSKRELKSKVISGINQEIEKLKKKKKNLKI